MRKKKLSRVFGVSKDLPMTYVERKNVDDRFRNNLAREKHIVVYGRSKQGKTCLHKNCFKEDDYIIIQCRSTMTTTDLYASIVKEAGAAVSITEKKTTSGTKKLGVEFSASGKIPIVAKGEAKVKGEGEKTSQSEIEKKYLEIDPTDPNDIIRTLKSMNFYKFIMLEDFHYLDKSVQAQVAIDLKAYHEKSSICCFIIVGVWLEPTRLLLYNGDLAGRLIPIDADVWKDDELLQVIEKGELLLNIRFSDKVKRAIIVSSQNNVGILQETCWRLCSNHEIWETQKDCYTINNDEEVDRIVEEIAKEQAGRYQNLLLYFADSDTKVDLVRWIAFVVITSPPQELITGIHFQSIASRIREYNPHEIKDSMIHSALLEIAQIQHDNKVQPLVLDYDLNANILRIVDSGFILYTEAVSEKELLRLIDLENVAKQVSNEQ